MSSTSRTALRPLIVGDGLFVQRRRQVARAFGIVDVLCLAVGLPPGVRTEPKAEALGRTVGRPQRPGCDRCRPRTRSVRFGPVACPLRRIRPAHRHRPDPDEPGREERASAATSKNALKIVSGTVAAPPFRSDPSGSDGGSESGAHNAVRVRDQRSTAPSQIGSRGRERPDVQRMHSRTEERTIAALWPSLSSSSER